MGLSPEGNRAARPQDDDWPLLRALAEDGRATYRELTARTHWHESTVRRRVEELVAAGTLPTMVRGYLQAPGAERTVSPG